VSAPPFTHIVLFKLNNRSAENIVDTAAILRGMAGRIPSLRELEVGVNEIHSGRAYDIALIARFNNRAGMEAYQVHPVHQKVVAHMHEVAESAVAVDYQGV
jgi:hypothetical protein